MPLNFDSHVKNNDSPHLRKVKRIPYSMNKSVNLNIHAKFSSNVSRMEKDLSLFMHPQESNPLQDTLLALERKAGDKRNVTTVVKQIQELEIVSQVSNSTEAINSNTTNTPLERLRNNSS